MKKTDEQKRGRGQPTKRTPRNLYTLLAIVEQGVSWRAAADALGVSRETLRLWRQDANTLALLTRARALGEIRLVRTVVDDHVNSKGAKFILERSYSERWRRRTDVSAKTDPIESTTAADGIWGQQSQDAYRCVPGGPPLAAS
jgi:hypothetical protein